MKIPLLLLIGFTLVACEKNVEPKLTDIFKEFGVDKNKALADGSTVIRVFCKLNSEATTDRREVKFRLSAGQFVSNKDTSIVQKCQFVNNELLADAYFQVPRSGERIIVTVQLNIPEIKNNKYSKSETITLEKSVPATLTISANSNAIASNYEQEVLLTATLMNDSKGKVSSGYRVLFEDNLQNGIPANGRFRAISDQVNSDGVASAIYSVGPLPIGQLLTLSCSLLDEAGHKIPPTNSLTLYINK